MSIEDFHKRHTLPELSPDLNEAAPVNEIPKMIGPYKIENLLEKGGMSILYLGVHPETKEPTTIKVLLQKYLSRPDVVQRFLNEAEIIAMTDHPNIVKLYGHGEWEGGLYIAMEFIQGISLRQSLLQNPISLKRALEIIIDVAYALCHLHTHGVIHRDLKPENILITDSGEVKVIDFGIAQLLTEKSADTPPGAQRLIGTPIYMSPEQRENPETVSYPSDIYSLGIISYELVLGKLSHGQIHLGLMPKGLQKILNKALQARPEDRYQDVVDFITDISGYLNSTNLDKEKKAGDQLSEISENLRNVQSILAPATVPAWPEVEIVQTSLKGLSISTIYYDFFSFPEGCYGILMGESSAKGAEGIIYTAMLRGMTHTLIKQAYKPADLVKALNQHIINDKNDEIFSFSYLLIWPKENKLDYVSCGHSHLWRISPKDQRAIKVGASHIALGIDPDAQFAEMTVPWETGDTLILSSFAADSPEETSEIIFEKAIQESIGIPNTQKMIESVLRKVKLSLSKTLQERALTVIGTLRK